MLKTLWDLSPVLTIYVLIALAIGASTTTALVLVWRDDRRIARAQAKVVPYAYDHDTTEQTVNIRTGNH